MPAESDLRQFIRDIAIRHERIWREQAEMLREMKAEFRALREESRAHREEMRIELRDLREESRAQTRALLQVLDRLENGGAAA